MSKRISRRSFLKKTGGAALGTATLAMLSAENATAQSSAPSFQSAWPKDAARPWAGPEYWTNPLQDWRIRQGRLECFAPGGDRNVFLLTREIAERDGDLTVSVRLGLLGNQAPQPGEGFVGFRTGIKSWVNDYRAAAVHGRGTNIGIAADGRLFIGEPQAAAPHVSLARELQLHLQAHPSAGGYTVVLQALDEDSHRLAEVTREVSGEWLTGGVALVSSSARIEPPWRPQGELEGYNFYPPGQKSGGAMRFWFTEWNVGGSKIDVHEERAFGPILFTLYTVSRGTLKLSAQFPPLGNAPREVKLQVQDDGGHWKTISEAKLDPDAWNAVFKVPSWSDTSDLAYRVVYTLPDASGKQQQHTYAGMIHKDPKDRDEITVGLTTCLWDMGFPHSELVSNIGYHKPDVLLWTGDQVYQPVGGFDVMETRDPALLVPSMLDYLRKWYIWGWSVRDLTRDIPSICMPDDHDMYHGNLWGCGGKATDPNLPPRSNAAEGSGGYKMPPRWVNMAQRAQASHLPDPFDPTPVLQGITVYYTDFRWGGVSFAILEDRKWKSAPKVEIPDAHIMNGFATDPHWDARKGDVPTAELLGQRQLDFLESWAGDWSGGVWMKFAVSQTRFGCLATEPVGDTNDSYDTKLSILPVGEYAPNDWMMADCDSGGWPQSGRNAGIRKWRKAFAMHLCGDQHLGGTSHYGVEDFRDGVYGVCTPALSSIFPRRWFPPNSGKNPQKGTRNTGDYLDRFGNHLTVFAIANPHQYPGSGLKGLRNRATGYSVLKCSKKTRQVEVVMWPRWVDPSKPGAKPYAGWPITIHQLDNGLFDADWTLDPIETRGHTDMVVQVQQDKSGDVVYTIRANGESFTPLVREPGTYRVIAFDPDGGYHREWRELSARKRQRS